MKAHKSRCLLVSQSHVAVPFLSSYFASKPGRGLKSSAAVAVWEFYLGHYKAGVSPLININLNDEILPRNFTAHLAQSSPRCSGPQRVELFWTEPDLAFFPVRAAADLESQRWGVGFFAETDLSTCRFACKIALLNDVASRAF